jgi:hypothetical protein
VVMPQGQAPQPGTSGSQSPRPPLDNAPVENTIPHPPQ